MPAAAASTTDDELQSPDFSPRTEKKADQGSQICDEKVKEARMDGGWRAWCSVVAAFLQFAICLGGPNAFGVFQAEYSLVQFPESSDLVSRSVYYVTPLSLRYRVM